MKILEVGDVVVKPGEAKRGNIEINCERVDKTSSKLPVIVINGEKEGPKLFMGAAIHGTDTVGVEVVQKIARGVNPVGLSGALIAIPIVNPHAFQYCQYFTPLDDYTGGLKRQSFWTKNPKGRQDARIQYAILTEALEKSSHAIAFYSNLQPCIPFVELPAQHAKDEETLKTGEGMAEAFGITVIESEPSAPPPPARGISASSMTHGRAAIDVHLPDPRIGDGFECGTRGIRNVMRHLGMIGGEMEKQTGVKIIRERVCSGGMLSTDHGGFVHWEVEPSEKKVLEGTVVCRITDIFGDETEVHRMPEDGYIFAWILALHGAYQLVNAGDNLVYYSVPVKQRE